MIDIESKNYTEQAFESLDGFGHMNYTMGLDDETVYCSDFRLFEDEDGELTIVAHVIEAGDNFTSEATREVFKSYEGIDSAVDWIDGIADMVVEAAYRLNEFYLPDHTIEEIEEVCQRWKRDVSGALETARKVRGE